jgi:hypothetical protein
VPPAWERCKRCDADLACAAPRELVGAARLSAAAAPGPPDPPSKPQSSTFTAFDPSAPIDVRDSYQRAPTVGESWAPVQAPKHRKLPIVGLLMTIVILGTSWIAWKQATARHIPAELKPYVHDGEGVDYSTPSGRFAVRLPSTPQEISQSVTVSGAAIAAAAALSITDEHIIGVAWFDMPYKMIATNDLDANLQQLAEGYAETEGDTLKELDFLTVQGYDAVDASFERDGASGKVRLILVGARVYVLLAGGTTGGPIGFEQLTDSFILA